MFHVSKSVKAVAYIEKQALDTIKTSSSSKSNNKLVYEFDRKLTKYGYYKSQYFCEGYLDKHADEIDSEVFLSNLNNEQKQEVKNYKIWQAKGNKIIEQDLAVTDSKLIHSKKILDSTLNPVLTYEDVIELVVLSYDKKYKNPTACNTFFDGRKKRKIPQYRLEKSAHRHILKLAVFSRFYQNAINLERWRHVLW